MIIGALWPFGGMTPRYTRRTILGVTATTVPLSVAGCTGRGGDTGGGLVEDGRIGVLLDNQHSQSHEVTITVVDSEGGEAYFERSVSLAPNEQSSGSFDDPGETVEFGVQARLADGQRETARIEGDQRVGLNLIRAVVLSDGQLAVFWSAKS